MNSSNLRHSSELLKHQSGGGPLNNNNNFDYHFDEQRAGERLSEKIDESDKLFEEDQYNDRRSSRSSNVHYDYKSEDNSLDEDFLNKVDF